MATAAPAYPVTLEVEYPEKLSRWLIFIKWLLVFPHLLILGVFGYLVELTTFISWFAILLTGRFPRSLFDFLVGIGRWSLRVNAYVWLMRDEYPPSAYREEKLRWSNPPLIPSPTTCPIQRSWGGSPRPSG